MAQGGTPTKEAMRGEIFDLLGRHSKGDSRVDGLIVNGMLKAIEGVQSRVEEKAGATLRKEMKGAFASMNLCGPRVMALPGKETTSLCELFYSYPHLMNSFQEQFKAMLPAAAGRRRRLLTHERGMSTNSKIGNHSSYAAGVLNAVLQKVDKVEKEDQALRKENSEIRKENSEIRKENSEIREQEKQMQQGFKSKGEEINALRKQLSLGSVQGTLKALTSQVARLQPSRRSSCLSDMAKLKFASREALKEKQEQFCKEYGLDLSDPRIVNVAMVYLGNDWGNKGKDAFLRRLQDGAKFSITDQCTHDKMFSPNDVSIQEIDKMDAPKGTKEWVLLMKLDWANEKGYLASQLQDSKDDNKCRKLDYHGDRPSSVRRQGEVLRGFK
jgi:cell division protein FtsB